MRWEWISAVAVACGNGGNSFSGTIRGQSLTPTESISGSTPVPTYPPNTAGLVLISSANDSCADAAARIQPKSAAAMLITLADFDASTGAPSAPAAPGSYTVSQTTVPKQAWVGFGATDASCNEFVSAVGASGTVTITGVSDSAYAGSFDVIFDSGDHVTGSFSASACAGLSTLFLSGADPFQIPAVEGTPPACF
jgi:hypothetical protein